MPSSYEYLQLPIVGYEKNEEISFEAFGVDYFKSKISDITQDGNLTVEHQDGSSDVFQIRDMKLKFTLSTELSAELAASAGRLSGMGTTTPEPIALFTINIPNTDVHHDADGNLLVVQSRGHYVGAVWVDGGSPPGGIVYGPPSAGQTPSGVVPVPPVYYPAPQNPPTESISGGVVNFPYYPAPNSPSYPSYPSYPAYNQPGWGSAPPQNVINNTAGGTIIINYRMKKVIQPIKMIEMMK